MKRLLKVVFILALILCFAIPAFAVKILPYNVPLQDLMKWDKYNATLVISNPEGERLTIAWATTVDLWSYDGATWTFNLPDGDTFAFGKGIAITGNSSISGTFTLDNTFNTTITTSATDPGRQVYWQFTSTAVGAGKQLQGIQIKTSWGGTADSTSGGITGAEIKARASSDSITHTLGQARAIVGNVDVKKAVFSKGYCFEAAVDVGSGGTITEAIGFRASLNNSGTITDGYAFYVDAVTNYPWEYGLYVEEGMAQTPIYVKNVDWGSGVDVTNIFSKITIDAAMGTGSAYVSQNHLITSGAFTINEAMAVSAYVNLGTGEITASGRVCALQAMISGDGTAGTVAGADKLYVAYIANRGTMIDTDAIVLIHNQSAATADAAIEFDIDGTVTNVFEFNGTVSNGWTSGDATGADFDAQDEYVLIPVTVEGVTPQLYILAAETYN